MRKTSRAIKPPIWLFDFVAQASLSSKSHSILYPISDCVKMDGLATLHKAFLSALGSTTIPVTFSEAVLDPKCCHAMNLELRALEEIMHGLSPPYPLEKGKLSANGSTYPSLIRMNY